MMSSKNRRFPDMLCARPVCAWILLGLVILPGAGAEEKSGDDPTETPRVAEARRQVEGLIDELVAAWNRGDLDGYCAGYAKTAIQVSSTGLIRGQEAICAAYHKAFPDRASMGHLEMEFLVFQALDRGKRPVQGADLVGRYTLSYPKDPSKKPQSGLSLLVFRRDVRGKWWIERDASF